METIVFLHGIGGAGRAWGRQMEYFSRRYQVMAWDVPGYEGRPILPEMSFESLCDQLASDIADIGSATVTLVGHSFGGMLAQTFVRLFPSRVARLALCGTSAAFGRPDGEFQKKFVAERTAPLDAGKTMADLAPTIMAGFQGKKANPEGVALAIDCMSCVPEETYRKILQLIVRFDERQALARISCPVLVLASTHDTAAPPDMMERMAGRIQGAKYVLMAGAGHLQPMEQPEKFNKILDQFLKETANVKTAAS